MNKYMQLAKECAEHGSNNNEGGPFGAVIVDSEGKIIAKANNMVLKITTQQLMQKLAQ